MRASTVCLATVRPALRAMWLVTLGLLLAFHATVSTPTATLFAHDEWRVAKVTPTAPLAAQFRESGQTVQIARASALSFKVQDGRGDGSPPLPGKAPAFAPPAPVASAIHGVAATALSPAKTRDAYRARAPPVGLHAA